MSEYDEEQPPPGPPRRAGGDYTRPNPWVAPRSEPPAYQAPTWPFPGRGQPSPAETDAATAPPGFAYPYRPSTATGRPNYGDPSARGRSQPAVPPPSFGAGPASDAPTYGSPRYGNPPYGPPPYRAPGYGGAGNGDTQAYGYGDPYGYRTPTHPGQAGGAWQPPPPYGPWTPPPGWSPQPPAPPKHTNPLAIIGVAILIAALIGLAIGGQLVHRDRSTAGRFPFSVPFSPTTSPTAPAAGGGGSTLPPSQANAIAAAVDPCVVDINTKLAYQRAAAAGTGMVLTGDGEVLTNNHVIAGSTSVTGTVIGGRTYTAKVLGTDPTEDVALIKLDNASGLTPCKFGDPSKLTAGQPIVAVGNAGGVGGTPSVVTGSVVALDQSVTASDVGGGNAETLYGLIEINAPLQQGDSGGPLVNTSSQVIGMDTAASASNQVESQSSVGFAIPITKAVAIAQQIAAGHAGGNIQIGLPGFLGVSVATDNAGVSGAPISGVIAGGPAEKAGLAAGDVITSINGQPVTSPKALTASLQQKHPGDKVTVGYLDATGKSHSTTITLTTGPAA